jgi:hypothetical protein
LSAEEGSSPGASGLTAPKGAQGCGQDGTEHFRSLADVPRPRTPTTFDIRVETAIAELRSGIERRRVHETHGRIVLEEAERMILFRERLFKRKVSDSVSLEERLASGESRSDSEPFE